MIKKLIREADVVAAAKSYKFILIDDQMVITPSAKDAAKELGVEFRRSLQPVSSKKPQAEDIFPVKVVGIGADHGGFELKGILISFIREKGLIVHDFGTTSNESCDYPNFAIAVAQAVAEKKIDCGIMIDSVGIGSAMAANRVHGVLAAKCNNAFEARSAREHNYANYLTMGGKIIGVEIAKEIVSVFLETPGGAERHQQRIQTILNL